MKRNVLRGQPGLEEVFLIPLGLWEMSQESHLQEALPGSEPGMPHILAPPSRKLVGIAGSGPVASDGIAGSPDSSSG